MSQSNSGQTSLTFILDGQVRQLSAVSATQTVLTYLREQLHAPALKRVARKAIAAHVPWCLASCMRVGYVCVR